MASLCGLFLTTFLIGLISQWLIPTRFEESALHWIMHKKFREKEADAAARLIQFTWRNYRHECKLEKELAEKDPTLYEETYEEEGKEFLRQFWRLARVFRNINRMRIEIEDMMNPIGRQNLEPADLMKLAKIEELRLDIEQKQMRTDAALRRLENLLITAINMSTSKGGGLGKTTASSSKNKRTGSSFVDDNDDGAKVQELS